MSKSITQDMRYRQSLMQYTAKYGVSRASRKYNKSRSYIYFWKARWDGSVASVQTTAPPSKPAHTGRVEAYPGYAKTESDAGHGGAVAPASQAWLYPLPGKSVSSHASAGNVPTAKGKNASQGKAL